MLGRRQATRTSDATAPLGKSIVEIGGAPRLLQFQALTIPIGPILLAWGKAPRPAIVFPVFAILETQKTGLWPKPCYSTPWLFLDPATMGGGGCVAGRHSGNARKPPIRGPVGVGSAPCNSSPRRCWGNGGRT